MTAVPLAYIKRTSSFVEQIKDLMNFTDIQIDEFWQSALSVNP